MKYSSTPYDALAKTALNKTINDKAALKRITKIALRYKYEVVFADLSMVILDKKVEEEHTIIQISMKDFSITTTIDHPKRGRTKLLRENIRNNQVNLVLKIISNPRLHCESYIKSTYL